MRFAIVMAVVAVSTLASAQDLPSGVVATVDAPSDAALARAREAGGARFRGERIDPAPAAVPEPPTEAVERLLELFFGADAEGCRDQLHDHVLDVDELVAAGHLRQAAQVVLFGAFCLAESNEAEARLRLERGLVRELPLVELVRDLGPERVGLFSEVRTEVGGREPIVVRIATEPEGAIVSRDGGAERCDAPCEMTMRPGSHVFVIERLGRRRAREVRTVDGSETIRFALPRAEPEELREQLAAALASGISPGSPEFLHAAADALGATVVVTAWADDRGARAALFDRRGEEPRAPVRADGMPSAVAAAITDWRDAVESSSLVPILIGTSLGVAGVAGAVIAVLAATGALTSRRFVVGSNE